MIIIRSHRIELMVCNAPCLCNILQRRHEMVSLDVGCPRKDEADQASKQVPMEIPRLKTNKVLGQDTVIKFPQLLQRVASNKPRKPCV